MPSAISAVLLLGLTGGHWAILQSVAWARMIVDYSRVLPVRTALAQTFDGEHPCALCKGIQKAKQASERQELQQPVQRDEAIYSETSTDGLDEPPCAWMTSAANPIPSTRKDPPPVPPPR
jgi:hypothetical protein